VKDSPGIASVPARSNPRRRHEIPGALPFARDVGQIPFWRAPETMAVGSLDDSNPHSPAVVCRVKGFVGIESQPTDPNSAQGAHGNRRPQAPPQKPPNTRGSPVKCSDGTPRRVTQFPPEGRGKVAKSIHDVQVSQKQKGCENGRKRRNQIRMKERFGITRVRWVLNADSRDSTRERNSSATEEGQENPEPPILTERHSCTSLCFVGYPTKQPLVSSEPPIFFGESLVR
jgi:hypothetical protein